VEKKENPSRENVTWVLNPLVCWRHPLLRICMAILVMVQDFWLYGEDPINDSYIKVNSPGVGQVYGLLVMWPAEKRYIFLRIVLIVVSQIVSYLFCFYVVHHRFLRDCMKLTMFEGSKGSLFISLFGAAVNLYGAAMIYNLIVPPELLLKPNPGFQALEYGKATQCFSVFLDVISIAMIIDTCLQDRKTWKDWGPNIKKCWNDACGGVVRVVVVWAGICLIVALTTFSILSTSHGDGAIKWDNRVLGGFTEVTRTLLISWMTVCDWLVVAQDWEFPTFRQPLDSDAMIAGTRWTHIHFPILEKHARKVCCNCNEAMHHLLSFHVTGKWFTYGPLLGVIAADLLCLKNQVMYVPKDWGQYVEPNTGRIWTVTNVTELDYMYPDGTLAHPELITWEARRHPKTGEPLFPSAATDVELNSRYCESSWKWLTMAPGLLSTVGFVALILAGNRLWHSHLFEEIGDTFEAMLVKAHIESAHKYDKEREPAT